MYLSDEVATYLVNKVYESIFLLAYRQTNANSRIILSKLVEILTFTVKQEYIASNLVQ